MNLDRRQFASAAWSGLALFVIPGWFAACARTDSKQVGQLEPGQRPRLVLHTPDDEARREVLGTLLGLYLMHAEDAELAWLAACDIECATTLQLDYRGFDLKRVHAVLFVPGEPPVAAIEGDFPYENLYAAPEGEPTREWSNAKLDVQLRARTKTNNAWIAAQLAKVLGPGSRASELGCARERERFGDLPIGQQPSFECALSTPFLSAAKAAQRPSQRVEWSGALASVVRERWRTISPQGSSWASYHGCGVDLETPPPSRELMTMACGIGHSPQYTRRFLYLFSADERAEFDR
ncbi:MAG: hypothetical protein NTV21_18320 [Planctomycetota bacterium]|nr:hypothetical protein [Planctomycetota bacterium]